MHEPYLLGPQRAGAGADAADGRTGQEAAPGWAGPAVTGWAEEAGQRDPQSPLRVTFTRPPATLRLSGVIDASNYAVLRRALDRATEGPDRSLFVDLSGVDFCDLAGLRALLSVATRKPVALAALPPEAHTILGILRWDETPGVTVLHTTGGPDERRGGPHPE